MFFKILEGRKLDSDLDKVFLNLFLVLPQLSFWTLVKSMADSQLSLLQESIWKQLNIIVNLNIWSGAQVIKK